MRLFRKLTTSLSLALLCVFTAVTSVKADNRDEIIFFFNDALGSAVAAVNEAGELCWEEVYTPYGDKTINDDLVNATGCGIVGEERGFTGHTEDVNSDLVYMQQRYYDPSIGRFLSIDPVDADPNNPMTYNRYAYANNNPYRYVDPNGEVPVLAWGVYVGVTAALTAYESYRTYQQGGAGALAGEVVVGAAISAIPGGRIAKSTLGTAADVADRVGDVPNRAGSSGDVVFHRLGDSAENIEKIKSSGQLRGNPPTNTYASDIPKVKAYSGPLPEGKQGFEFTTDAIPDRGGHPALPTWSGNRPGVTTENGQAIISCTVTNTNC